MKENYHDIRVRPRNSKEFRTLASRENYGDAVSLAKALTESHYKVEVVHIHKQTVGIYSQPRKP